MKELILYTRVDGLNHPTNQSRPTILDLYESSQKAIQINLGLLGSIRDTEKQTVFSLLVNGLHSAILSQSTPIVR